MLSIRWLCSVTHGPGPSLHPLHSPPCPWRIAFWVLNYHVTLLPPIILLEEKKNSVCAVWKGTRLGEDACWPAGNRFPNSVSTWGCFKLFFVQGSCLVGGVKTARDHKPLRVRTVVCIMLYLFRPLLWRLCFGCRPVQCLERVNKMGQVSSCCRKAWRWIIVRNFLLDLLYSLGAYIMRVLFSLCIFFCYLLY
jgi:hypothetical protein